MTTVVVRYKVKPEWVNENVKLVEAVFADLKKNSPEGLHYAAFTAEDGVSFIHVANVDDTIENPLFQLDSFKSFQKDIADRCDELPDVAQVSEIGTYNFFA